MAEVKDYITLDEEKGSINISEEVIVVIAASAAAEVDGVASLATSVGKDLSEALGKKSISKGVRITVEDGAITADVCILVKFGCQVNKVAQDVQSSVSSAVEAMSGVPVKQVNVHICGITFERPAGK